MTNHWQRRAAVAAAESAGVGVECYAYPGWKFSVRRRCQWNASYQRAVVRASARPEIAALLTKPSAEYTDADRALDAAYTRETFAEGCVAAWHGVTDERGKPFPLTVPNAVRLFEAFPDIFAELYAASGDASRYAAPADTAKAEATEGN